MSPFKFLPTLTLLPLSIGCLTSYPHPKAEHLVCIANNGGGGPMALYWETFRILTIDYRTYNCASLILEGTVKLYLKPGVAERLIPMPEFQFSELNPCWGAVIANTPHIDVYSLQPINCPTNKSGRIDDLPRSEGSGR